MSEKIEITQEDIEKFDNQMHRLGRISTIITLTMLVAAPLVMALYFDISISWGAVIASAIALCLLFIPSSLVEVITYAPMLGTGATYLAFITGNLTNLKIPCCMNARTIVGTEFGTKENEIVSTISVAISAIVTCLVLAIGVLLLVPLEPIISSPTLQPAFATVVPALFGALGYQYIKTMPKVAIFPFVVLAAISFFVPSLGGEVFILIVIGAPISLIVARIFYKRGEL